MKVVVTKQFYRDVDKELDKPMRLQLAGLIEQIQHTSSLQEIPNLKKL